MQIACSPICSSELHLCCYDLVPFVSSETGAPGCGSPTIPLSLHYLADMMCKVAASACGKLFCGS